jgi:hypothetical protein
MKRSIDNGRATKSEGRLMEVCLGFYRYTRNKICEHRNTDNSLIMGGVKNRSFYKGLVPSIYRIVDFIVSECKNDLVANTGTIGASAKKQSIEKYLRMMDVLKENMDSMVGKITDTEEVLFKCLNAAE